MLTLRFSAWLRSWNRRLQFSNFHFSTPVLVSFFFIAMSIIGTLVASAYETFGQSVINGGEGNDQLRGTDGNDTMDWS